MDDGDGSRLEWATLPRRMKPMPTHPDTIREIEERSLAAWPAPRSVAFGGWIFREAGGYTKRANSANALRPDRDFDEVRGEAERYYAAKGLPTIFRVTPLAGAATDERLADAGYRRADETSVETLPLSRAEIDPGVRLRFAADEAWSEGFARANGVPPARRALHDRILALIATPTARAEIAIDDRAVAFGLAVLDRGSLGLFDIAVAPAFRRRGLARRVVSALLGWGAEAGATKAYLQVTVANEAARALYRDLGFRETYRYHYRLPES